MDLGGGVVEPGIGWIDISILFARVRDFSFKDDLAIEDLEQALVEAINHELQRQGMAFETKRQRPLKVSGLTGIQYDLSASGMQGVMRIFSRRVGDVRELYALCVLNASDKTPAADKFLSSFSFSRKK